MVISKSELSFQLFYSSYLKKFDKVKCITSMQYIEGKFYCKSPFSETEDRTFCFSSVGWSDSSVSKKGSAEDFLCDLAGLDRGSVEMFSIIDSVGVPVPLSSKLVCTYEQLLTLDLPVPETWLGGFVSPGEATLLVALPGIGKTWFTMAIAQVLADGQKLLGSWKPKAQKRTLLIDFEMQPNRIKHRLELLRKGYSAQNTGTSIGILSPELAMRNGFTFNDLSKPDQLKLLYESIADYDVVVIDNVNAAYPSTEDDENSPKFWMNPQTLVMGIRQTGKACIMVHHSTKGDPKNPAGSGKNVRFFDNVMAMVDITDYSVTDVKKVKIHVKKSRNFSVLRESQPELELRDFNGGVFWSLTDGVRESNVNNYLPYAEKDDIPW